MAKKNNPTGLSTGQGKGAAQVLGNTYNPYFKERLTEAKKKDKEVTDAMAKASDASQLWSRDVGAFKPMVNDLQSFYRDNARAIIKGDFDATLKLKQMQNEMSQYVASSKDSQKYANEMLKLVNKPGSNYTDESRQKIFDFVSQAQAGNFDTSGLILNEKYDASDALKAISDEAYKIGYTAQKPFYNDQGILVNKLVQSKEAVEEIVKKRRDNDIKFYGEEARKFWTDEQTLTTIEQTEALLGEKQTASNKPIRYDSGSDQVVQAFDFDASEVETTLNVPFATNVTETGEQADENIPKNSLGYNKGKVKSQNSVKYETSVTFRFKPSAEAVPIGGNFVSQSFLANDKDPRYIGKDKKNKMIGGRAEAGNSFVLDDLKEGFKSGAWTVSESMILNTFPTGYKSRSGVDLEGMPIDDKSLNTQMYKDQVKDGKPEKRYYAVLENKGQVVLEPYHKAHKSIVQQYKGDNRDRYNEWYEKTKNYLAEQGWSKAYEDFTNQELPSSDKTKTASSAAEIAAKLAAKAKEENK